MRRLLSLLSALLLTAGALAGCSLLDQSADPAADFAAALSRGDSVAAAAATTSSDAATTIKRSLTGMGITPRVNVSDTTDGAATLRYTWDFGRGRVVDYTTAATIDGEKLLWSAHLIHPSLPAGGFLQFSPLTDPEVPVLDANGHPLMQWQTVTVVSVQDVPTDTVASDLAQVLRRVDASVSARSIISGSKPGQLNPVITLRRNDFRPVAAQLRAIPQVTLTEQGRLLTVTKALRSPALAELPDLWQQRIDAAAGWTVGLLDAAGNPVRSVKTVAPQGVDPLVTTLDGELQLRIQNAVNTETKAAAVVAIRPSTGGILAVAQNAAANRRGPIALTGLFPPGSTFKTITTTAALNGGLTGLDHRVHCPGETTLADRTIPNEDNFDLGIVPLHTAFAQSCNTTMAMLAGQLAPTALRDTALSMGLGVDYVTPGLTTVTGSVPRTDTPAQRVETAIGQGTVLASPFGLAIVEASLAGGRTAIPSLIVGEPAQANHEVAQLNPDSRAALRTMMTETVTSGSARQLAGITDLGGKTGTAEYDNNAHAHGWFVGIQGDLAFAVLVVQGESSAPAVAIAKSFLS